MKLIDVLNKLSKGEVKDGTTLTLKAKNNRQYKYIKNCFLDDYRFPINIYDESDLNSDVIFIEPITKEYHLKLYEEDDLSYVVRSSYNSDFKYDLGSKDELIESQTKFEQEEIDNDKLLKFVEMYGIKEEVEEDAND